MRLALVCPEYPPDAIGGGGVVFRALAHEYSRRHEVCVFTGADALRSWTGAGTTERDGSVEVRRYPTVDIGRTPPYLRTVLPANPVASLRLRRDLDAWAPDVAHVHGFGYLFVDLAAAVLAARAVPYVFTNHGLPTTPVSAPAPLRYLYGLYERRVAGRTLRRSVRRTGISHAATQQLEELGVSAATVENGVVPPSEATGAGTEWEGLGPLVVAAGRLAPSKGFDLLLEALERSRYRPLRCVIAGADGGELTRLQRMAARLPPGVTASFPGWLSTERMAELFAAAGVVAVPSRDEPFGLVALEALVAGRRVVAADTGGLRDFVRPPLGRLTSASPDALARAIDEAIAGGSPSPEEHEQARQLRIGKSWSGVAQQYEALLIQATGGSGQGPRTSAAPQRST